MREKLSIPRFVPDRNLPEYTFIPGEAPHPINDPEGHSYGKPEPSPASLDPGNWKQSGSYLFGIDLFNHGFYWEAHEEWEGLWHATGHTTGAGDFLKGLIKLAAAGVKMRQRNEHGKTKHSGDAGEIFRNFQERGIEKYVGLSLQTLVEFARDIGGHPDLDSQPDPWEPKPIFTERLLPQ
ncbi:MAG: DUF309 domain-containing protein [Candidatus Marinimicrobia bacterium]|nr:DUF309 domain-containing protein [Candidatus Neomarinimicrobiota bacterium]MCF7828505.1 DUF309 domain-containing protein [Candidatus Neomarinimicrobiota bacterium]MCF7881995.1 DUF309 domain-containing protein [Candidatus Neomarinimicrobiota bacterium]